MDRYDYNLRDALQLDLISNKQTESILFQIIQAFYILQKYLGLIQGDAGPGNIVLKKIPQKGHWEYIIDGITYYVPSTGYKAVVIDFGTSVMKDFNIRTKTIKGCLYDDPYNENYYLEEIINPKEHLYFILLFNKIPKINKFINKYIKTHKGVITIIDSGPTPKHTLSILFEEKYKKKPKDILLDKFMS